MENHKLNVDHVGGCEIDDATMQVLLHNFKPKVAFRDVRTMAADMSKVPAHDILMAGFPCQPYAPCGKGEGIAGLRGQLIFEIMKIIEDHRL